MNKEKENFQDVSSIFVEAGIETSAKIKVIEHTYEVDPDKPKNNWLYPAFEGFKKLKTRLSEQNKSTIETFAVIGSGQGVDAIGAYHIFHPKNIIITDIHPTVVPVARQNFLDNVPTNEVSALALVGNLCEPLAHLNIKADIIYANLPNIPLTKSDSVFAGQLTSTFFDISTIKKCPHNLKRYLLDLQNAFLHTAHNSLKPGGSTILNLGGRVPIELIKSMFENAGFEYQELFNMFKVQTQPEWVLGGYARAEEKYNITFDFYRYNIVYKKFCDQLKNKDTSAIELKQLLKPFRISATEALKLFVYNNECIGHIVQVIRGIKK